MQIVPERACDIITAWCVLFNISKDLREPNLDPDNYQHQVDEDHNENDVAEENIAAGNAVRANIIDNFFV